MPAQLLTAMSSITGLTPDPFLSPCRGRFGMAEATTFSMYLSESNHVF